MKEDTKAKIAHAARTGGAVGVGVAAGVGAAGLGIMLGLPAIIILLIGAGLVWLVGAARTEPDESLQAQAA